jgi:hypothetical protein
MGRQIADTGLWCMCFGCGMGTASSDLFNFVPGAFPFHVSCSDSG